MAIFLTASAAILDAMRACIDQQQPACIAVAFWGRDAARQLELHRAAPGTRILLNALSGACNPTELKVLREDHPAVAVRSLARLHAKVVIGSGRMVVGSANASANGLGFQGEDAMVGWREACTVVEASNAVAEAERWFEQLWGEADELTPAIIEAAKRARDRLVRHAQAVAHTIGTRVVLEGTQIYVVLTDEDSTLDEAEAKREVAKRGAGTTGVEFYQNWPKIPQKALLLAYCIEPGSSSAWFDAPCVTREGFHSVKVRNRQVGHPVFPMTEADRAEFGMPRALNWTRSVNAVVAHLQSKSARDALRKRPGVQIGSRATDWCIPLHEFLRLCRTHDLPMPPPWTTPIGEPEPA